MQDLQAKLRRLERRDWWLWWLAVFILLLLTAAVGFSTLPTTWTPQDIVFQFNLTQAVRGLVGMVLLFIVYMTYQRVQVRRLRQQLAEQLEVMWKLQVRAQEFEKLAILDPLTGLYNRRFAEQRLREEIARAARSNEPLTVLLIDLDEFKQINDFYGHATGDLVLRHFSSRLEKVIRVSDVAVRWGGDEFLVLLPDFHHGSVEELLHRLEPIELQVQAQKLTVGFSAGWTDHQAGETPEQLLERTDQALYERKRTGKHFGRTNIPASQLAPSALTGTA